jgi:DNA-binding sugar fermentation-stimulating protein
VTIAGTPARTRGAKPQTTSQRTTRHRREVTTMRQKLQALLFFVVKLARRQTTPFNGDLLDQKREDVFVALHRMGNFR